MSQRTVATWRALLAGGATAKQDELVDRLTELEAWGHSRIHRCAQQIEAADEVISIYTESSLMGRQAERERSRASGERTALEAALRILNGEP